MKRMKIFVLLMIVLLIITGLYACADTGSIAKVHPAEIKDLKEAVCSSCHDDDRASMDHKDDWIGRHKFYAAQKKQVCGLCHDESFCSDCHANRSGGLMPSDEHKDAPERWVPHRGDYLTQHMIDGRINPAQCMECHGRRNNAICRECHK